MTKLTKRLDHENLRLHEMSPQSKKINDQKAKCYRIVECLADLNDQLREAKEALNQRNERKRDLEEKQRKAMAELEAKVEESARKHKEKVEECESLQLQVQALQNEHFDNEKLCEELKKLQEAKEHITNTYHEAVIKLLRDTSKRMQSES